MNDTYAYTYICNLLQDENGQLEVGKSISWIHSDVMDDNIHIEACGENEKSWRATHIIDLSNLSIGDPICDLIPIHLDVFRGEPRLLRQFLESYKLPLVRRKLGNTKRCRLSFLTM